MGVLDVEKRLERSLVALFEGGFVFIEKFLVLRRGAGLEPSAQRCDQQSCQKRNRFHKRLVSNRGGGETKLIRAGAYPFQTAALLRPTCHASASDEDDHSGIHPGRSSAHRFQSAWSRRKS